MARMESSTASAQLASPSEVVASLATMSVSPTTLEAASSTPSDFPPQTTPCPPMPFRVWSANRKIKKSLVGRTCGDVISKAASKMEIPEPNKCRLVLEACGTEVDDDEYLRMLPANSVLMLLRADERWLQVQWSPTRLTSSAAEENAIFSFPPIANSPMSKYGQGPYPFPVKTLTNSKSPENSGSSSGSREGSLPLPSPSAFASLKSFTLDGSLPTVFSIPTNGGLCHPAAAPPLVNGGLVPASTIALPVSSPRSGGADGATSIQQLQHPLPFQQQSRQEMSSPTRDEDYGVTSSDGGVSSTGLLIGGQNGIVQGVVGNGTASNGHGLTPIFLSGSAAVAGETSQSHIEGMSAEAGPIYAIGPLGPFFVAAGNGSGIGKAESMTANGSVVIGGGGPAGANCGSSSVVLNVNGGPAGKEKSIVSNLQEIVTPPNFSDAQEMVSLKKKTDERFKRKSKNLPCTVPGCHKTFRDEYDRKTHLRCHTGERPFKCFSCDKTFAHVSSRIHHHKTLHLNKREFICSVCGKSFVKRIEAQRHQWNAHRIPSAPPSRREGPVIVDSTTDVNSRDLVQ